MRPRAAAHKLMLYAPGRHISMPVQTPMREAQADGRREAILDLGERRPIPDATATLAQFQQMLDNDVADDTPAPRGCSEEILEPLRAARARANKILLGD